SGGRLAVARQVDPYLVENAVYLHVDGNADGIGKTERVGRAVALDRDPAQAKKYRAIVPPRVAAHAQLPERPASKQVTNSRRERVAEGCLQKLAEELGSSFGWLDGDVAGEHVGDYGRDGTARNVAAFDTRH